jgi:hypothetical protein
MDRAAEKPPGMARLEAFQTDRIPPSLRHFGEAWLLAGAIKLWNFSRAGWIDFSTEGFCRRKLE